MTRYLAEISYMGGPDQWRVLDGTSLVLFLSHNHERLHFEGEGYAILSIGQYLGPQQFRPLTLRQVERHRDSDYLCWSYELASADQSSQGNDPELPEMAFTVRIHGRT